MLTSLNRMVGLPVVWQDRQLGYVERAVPDARARRLSGVVVRKGIGAAKWVSSDGIAVVGSRCVLIRQKPGAVPDSRTRILPRRGVRISGFPERRPRSVRSVPSGRKTSRLSLAIRSGTRSGYPFSTSNSMVLPSAEIRVIFTCVKIIGSKSSVRLRMVKLVQSSILKM